MTTIITAIILFGVIVLIHELGHFLTAKWVGIPAEEFSIGMGPKLYQYKGKNTVFSIRGLPIGGYVKFIGEDEKSDDPRAFNNAEVWKRFLVILSGPLMNFVLAALLLATFLMCFGTVKVSPHVLDVIDGSPAQQAGLQKGDKIIGIDDIEIDEKDEEKSIELFMDKIKEEGDRPLNITILREDQIKEVEIQPSYSEEEKAYKIGIYFGKRERHGLISAIGLGFRETGRLIVMMVQVVGNLIFKGQGLKDVVGPVGIVREINNAVKSGLQDIINFAIVITLNLGIMNLLPFPALDGGRLVLLVVEGLRGKPIDANKEGFIHFLGFIMLMILMIVVTFKDIANLWF